MSSETGSQWIVLLEAADEGKASPIDPFSFARLVCSWASPAPTTLYSPNRYALQVAVRATDPVSALSSAMSLWKNALRRTGLPEWHLVRAEIMTPEELEQESQAGEAGSDDQDAPCRTGDVVGDDLLRRALHDSVTGLPSRELFLDDVRRALAAGASASAVPAVMIVHLDGLDTVNASLGCWRPDDVLVEIAGRLTEVVRRCDTVARLGPAEFALLVEAASGTDTDRLARRIVDRFRRPLLDEGQGLAVKASVGVVMSSSTDDAEELILLAGVAVATAREASSDGHRRFPPNAEDG